ncbi:MAG: CHAD domain-containing protein [Chromatocurvus sp.]
MAFKFNPRESAGDGIRRMAREQMDKALAEIDDSGLDRQQTVHQVRKRCKKIRALLQLARGDLDNAGKVYQRENACFRDAARSLSNVRDAEALLETCDKLIDASPRQDKRQRLENARHVLEERRLTAVQDDIGLDERIDAFAATLRAARQRVEAWPIGDSFAALAPGLKKNYRRGRKAMKSAVKTPSTDKLHEWRKRVKYHRYHLQVLRPTWDAVLHAWQDELNDMGEALGDDHDLAVFTATLSEEHARFTSNRELRALVGLCDRRRAQLQARVFPLGQRAFTEKPKHLVRRLEVYWKASRSEFPLPAHD